MKAALIFIITVIFQTVGLSQQFQLEATIEKHVSAIFDIDGDGICEYIADTNKVYDGASHNLKYTLPNGNIFWNENQRAQNPYSYFPHIDFNGDGKREIMMLTASPDNQLIIYDLVNSMNLFQFGPANESVYFKELIDIDGDQELELIIRGAIPGGEYKTYVYSTGVSITGVNQIYHESINGYKLEQNFPNPFNPSTTIRYSITSPENVSINIYDVSGQLVKEITKDHNQAGEYEVIWGGMNNYNQKVSSGAYFYQITAGNYVEAKKMILLK